MIGLYSRYKIAIGYTLSSLFRALTHLAAMFFVSRFVAPAELGYWTFLLSFVTYASFMNAGVTNGLNRELPFYISRNKEDYALTLVSTAQSYLNCCVLITLFFGTVISIYSGFSNSLNQGLTVFGITLLTILSLYEGYIITTYRSNEAFGSLARIQTIYGVLGFLSIILIYYFGYWGMILRLIISQGLFVYLLHLNRPFKVESKFSKKALFDLLKIGVPIFLLAYLQNSAATFDKILLYYKTGNVQLGYYSFANYGFMAISMLTVALASYVYPKMTYLYGHSNDKRLLWKFYVKITIFVTALMACVAVVACLSISFLVDRLFPNYMAAKDLMKLLCVAGAIAGSNIGSNMLWALKNWILMSTQQISTAILLVLCPLLMSSIITDTATGIAYGLIIAYTLSYLLTIFLAYRSTI